MLREAHQGNLSSIVHAFQPINIDTSDRQIMDFVNMTMKRISHRRALRVQQFLETYRRIKFDSREREIIYHKTPYMVSCLCKKIPISSNHAVAEYGSSPLGNPCN